MDPADIVVAYLSSMGDHIHDARFVEKLSALHRKSYFVTFAPELPAFVRDAAGVEGVCLASRWWPFENPERPGYNAKARWHLRVAQHVNALRLREWLHQHDVDVLHAGWVVTDGHVAALSGFHPFLLMPWGSDILWLDRDWRRRNRKAALRALRASDAITCDAQIVADHILALEPGCADREIVQFPWGIDLARFHPPATPRSSDGPLRVISMKGLVENSGFATLVDAAAILRERGVALEADIYGDGPLHDELTARIRDRDVGDMVRLRGLVANALLPDLLREADVYAAMTFSEGTSLSMMEAMACELPVVVTDLPAYRQWVTPDRGWRTPPGDAEALANALEQAARDPAARHAKGAANADLARQDFDWNQNFVKLQQLYVRLANGG